MLRGNTAVGVECITKVPGESAGPIRHLIRANKLVILSAGAISSPQILERSGIGSEAILKKMGAKVIVSDLPGVGINYQDHELILVPYRATPETVTFDEIWSGNPSSMEKNLKDYESGKGSLTGKWVWWSRYLWTSLTLTDWTISLCSWVDSGVLLRPSTNELRSFGPEFKRYWDKMFEDAPDKVKTFFFCERGSSYEPFLTTVWAYALLTSYFGHAARAYNGYDRWLRRGLQKLTNREIVRDLSYKSSIEEVVCIVTTDMSRFATSLSFRVLMDVVLPLGTLWHTPKAWGTFTLPLLTI